MTTLLEQLNKAKEKGTLPEKVYSVFLGLYMTYRESLQAVGLSISDHESIFHTLLARVEEQVKNPTPFEGYHAAVTSPFDYYHFGLDFLRPLVDFNKSIVLHIENVERMQNQINNNENVVLFANHQTESDPQLISILLEKDFPTFGREMIFVAGDRVLTDPMAVPFSLGRNLLCIYSKKHIDSPPEKREEKQRHNKRVMLHMSKLFKEGGKCVFVAPSGGRDRPNEKGEVEVAPFDPQSIEMFRLMAHQSERTTHFYPLAVATYDILPPPRTVEKELGETRHIRREGASLAFGNEIDMENFPGSEVKDRHERRLALSQHIWNLVYSDYLKLTGES